MLYQLPDGRTIEMSLEDYLSFSDEELSRLKGIPYLGAEINSPLYGSSIKKIGKKTSQEKDYYGDTEIPDVPNYEKLDDQDYIIEDE